MVKRQVMRVLVSILLFIAFTVTGYAWLCVVSDILDGNLDGSAVMGYFEGGEGTKEKPYLIKYPYQVYNLAWLQYLGQFNKEDKDGNIIQVYFQLIDDINMENMVLPPIGTYDNPFVGHFDGAGHLIYNLTVSNYLDIDTAETEFGIVTRPLSVTEIDPEEKMVSVVGFFGVVGALDEQTKKKLADDSSVAEISEKVNAVHDLFLDNVTIRTETMETLAGVFAGYVNASVSNVGVGLGTIYVGEDGMPLSALDMGYAISLYSLIGKYDASGVSWEGLPGATVGGTGGTDGNTGWGGSVNMLEIRKRVSYITGAAGLTQATVSGSTMNYYVDAYGYSGWFSSKQQYLLTYTSRSTRASFLEGTVMPLSVDPSIFTDEITDSSTGLITLAYYQNNKGSAQELALSTNTAYLVGGGDRHYYSNGAYIDFVPEYPGGYNKSTSDGIGIYKSFQTAWGTRGAFPTDTLNTVFHFLTIDAEGKTYVIQDTYNTQNGSNKSGTYFSQNASKYNFKSYVDLGFQKYIQMNDGVDTGVRTSYINANAGATLIQGISFNHAIDVNNLELTYADVILAGVTKNNYALIDGAINFSVNTPGIVTAIAGTYRYDENSSSNNAQSLFSIFQVIRGEDNDIDEVIKINAIYEERDEDKNIVGYIYNSVSNPVKGHTYTKIYDAVNMAILSEAGAAYYFEIPLNTGEYALGGTNSGAYLLYLDIGINGNEDLITTPTTSQTAHKVSDVVFVDDAGIDNRTTAGYNPVVFAVTLGEDVTREHDTLKLVIDRTATDNINYTVTNKEGDEQSDFTVTPKKDDKNIKINGKE